MTRRSTEYFKAVKILCINELFLLYYIKTHQSNLTILIALFPMYDFVTSCIGHLKNIGSLSYTDLCNIDTFY